MPGSKAPESKLARHIFLTGFMGAGKTTIGQRLAEKIGVDFVDTDSLLEKKSGQKISDIFRERGEAYFRDLESTILHNLSTHKPAVIATGGGIIESERNRYFMNQHGYVLFLKCDINLLLDRIVRRHTSRPLVAEVPPARQRQQLRQKYLRREPLYLQADLVLECPSEWSPAEVAQKIVDKFNGEFELR